jgi:type I restriction enzyme S subunit
MGGEWIETTLGRAVDFLSGGTPSKSRADYWYGSVPWVSAKDMKRFHLEDTEDHLTDTGTKNGTRVVPAGTVLLLARGMTLLNDVPICVVRRAMAFNQDVKAVRPKAGVRNDFLPYLLLAHKERLLAAVDLAGHGTGRLNSDELKSLRVRLPPAPEQGAIAHILGMLDDKIELNRWMSETLEAMARALFKSWFVDFDPVRAKMAGRDPGLPKPLADLFPSRLVDSELGEIPEGWEARLAGQLFAIGIGKTPPRNEPQWFSRDDTDVPWISIKDMGHADAFIFRVSEYLTASAVDRFHIRQIPTDTVVLSFKLTVGRVAITDGSMVSNEAIAHFVPRSTTFISAPFLYCYLRQFDYESLGSTSSIATAVNSQSVRAIPTIVPSQNVHGAFLRAVSAAFERLRLLQRESQQLECLRDALLPKLVSGELRVRNADKLVASQA